MRDGLVHAGTGMGKTTIVAGPHAHESSAGKVTLFISPLIALHDEQVETFRDEFGLKAIAVNSSNGGCKPEVLQVMPPAKLYMGSTKSFYSHQKWPCLAVVDEAHVVSHWGASFRKKYGTLGTIRAFLPRGTPMIALSATLPARVRNDVLSKLQFSKDYVNIDIGNDPTKCLDNHNITTGVEIIDHLTSLLPPELQDAVQGYDIPIRPYNAALSKEYRKKAMEKFREGTVRILVCTDAAGMGCNIPDIDVVVQWKLPASVSVFVQRAGRAARAHGRTGIAILLVEPSAYAIDLRAEVEKEHGAKGKKKEKAKEKESEAEKRKKAQERKAYAKSRGVDRGAAGGKHDAVLVADTPVLDPEASNEGLYVFVQTGTCRRAILTTIYGNQPANPTVACCDICCPELLDIVRPGKRPKVARQSAIKRGEVHKDLQAVLDKWRTTIKERDYPSPLFAASAILRDETIALLSSVGPIDSKEHLQKVLAGQWTWWTKYGTELYECLAAQEIPEMVPLPAKTKGKKRAVEMGPESGVEVGASTSKRRRVDGPRITAGSIPVAGMDSRTPAATTTRKITRAVAQTPEEIRASFQPSPEATALWDSDPGIAPPSNPSFVPMESAPQEVQDKIWERVLYFALRMEELDVYASSDVHVAVPNDSDHYDYSDDLEPLLMSDSMLVSKRFNRLSAPFLYRHADLVNPGDLSRFAAVLSGDRTIAKHVRSLAFTYEAMLPSMPDDDLLDFSQEMKEGCHHKLRSDAEDLLLSILPFLDGLVSFTDGSTNTSYPPHLQSNEGLVLPWTALRTLATAAGANLLRLCVGVIPPSEIQSPLVLEPFLALRSLEWQCSVEFGLDPAEPTLAPEALANLECLSLVEYHPSFMGVLAAAELPALRRVYFHASLAPTVKRFFERHGGKLTEVRLGAHDPGEVNVLDACPTLPRLICGSHGNFGKPSEAKSLPSVELLTPSKPHLHLTKLILDAYFADHRKEKTMGPFLDSLDTALLPALREIQVPILRWPTTEREISKSPWIQCAEKLLSRGIALQDANGKHWTPRLKRGLSLLRRIIKGPLPLRRSLDLYLVDDDDGSALIPTHIVIREAPLLRTVVLNDIAAEPLTLPWAQLTSLTLRPVFLRECVSILACIESRGL
ncbi:hypothetical protein B0H14DRAFT_3446642 [Mycena olivaceomarginata]|nr:hypothetical protein B0H14DRAFT_3446642 [Mycena olivaceomarginata]